MVNLLTWSLDTFMTRFLDYSHSDIRLQVITTNQEIQAVLEESVEVLSEEEVHNAALYRELEDQKSYRVAHAIKRQMLSEIDREIRGESIAISPAEWLFGSTIYGRPVVRQEIGRIYTFSLSHTRTAAACVVSARPHMGVGVDIEAMFTCPLEPLVEEHILTDEEMESLVGCTSDERARLQTRLWTLKEAWLKATGLGLNLPMGRAGFRLDGSLSENAEIPDWIEAGCRLLGSGQQNNYCWSAVTTGLRRSEAAKPELKGDFVGGLRHPECLPE